MPFLQYQKDGKREYFEIPADRMAIFGREEHVDFQLAMDALISREHFGVELDENGSALLIDLGASNGTFYNGRRLDNETVKLLPGDEVRAGSQVFTYYGIKPKDADAQQELNELHRPESEKTFGTKMWEIVKNYKKN